MVASKECKLVYDSGFKVEEGPPLGAPLGTPLGTPLVWFIWVIGFEEAPARRVGGGPLPRGCMWFIGSAAGFSTAGEVAPTL